MNLNLYTNIANNYTSSSQKIRNLSEYWFENNMYCPNCLNNHIIKLPNNYRASDFQCDKCKNTFELKSSSKKFGKKVVDGEYNTMINALLYNRTPNFFFMQYSKDSWSVKNIFIVPKFFFSESLIEKRKELSETARRHGWVGCNILLNRIPEDGKIDVIKNEKIIEKSKVNKRYKKLIFLNTKNAASRGWASDTLKIIRDLNKTEFSLKDLYEYKCELKKLHPENNNIEAKIRQQLQILRDNKIISFDYSGHYILIK